MSEHNVRGYRNGCRCSECRNAWRVYCLQRAREKGRPARRPRVETEKAGPRRFYAGIRPKPVSITLTDLGFRILEDAVRRTRKSRGDVVERLLRKHGKGVKFEEEKV